MSELAVVAMVVLALDVVFVVAYIVNFRHACELMRIPRQLRPWWAR